MTTTSTLVPEHSVVKVQCIIDALPAATEIQLSRWDGTFFSSTNNSLNRDIGSGIATTNQVTYKFTADSEWVGYISCYGRNEVDSGKKSVYLTVQSMISGCAKMLSSLSFFALYTAKPVAPKLCENKTITSSRSLIYSFNLEDDGNSPITAVMITCFKVTTHSTLDFTTRYSHTTKTFNTPNCTMGELENLTPATKYGCQLQATNDVGMGEASARFYQTTEAAGIACL